MSDERGAGAAGAGRRGSGPESGAGGGEGEARIGVLGEGVDDLLTAADAVGRAQSGAEDADAVVAVGEAGLGALPREFEAPVLAVDIDAPLSAGRRRARGLLSALAAGRLPTVDVTVAEITHPNGRERALFDAMLVAAEPARISEYAVIDGRELASYRADGIVVATPLGSHEYAADAGGPAITLDTDALTVVPVAPFAIDADRWVLSPPATLRVERDEAPVDLLVDGRRIGPVPPEAPVRIERGGSISMVTPPEP